MESIESGYVPIKDPIHFDHERSVTEVFCDQCKEGERKDKDSEVENRGISHSMNFFSEPTNYVWYLECTCLFIISPPKHLTHNHLDSGSSHLLCASAVTLLSNGKLDTLALWQTDPWLLLANDENVALTGGELVVESILDVDNSESTVVTLTVSDDTNTSHVATTSGHCDDTGVKVDEVSDLASGQVDLDSVVDAYGWVGVADTVLRLASCLDYGKSHIWEVASIEPLLPYEKARIGQLRLFLFSGQ